MARFRCLMLVGGLVLVGCAPGNVVQKLPPPNFNGPVISAPVAGATQPPSVTTPRPVPGRQGLSSERAWAITTAPRAWKWIVIHHSATPSGSAAVFDRMHRQKGWDELGYHFVIGNGTDSGNGRVEVGPRWPRQKWGAHAKTPDNRFNDYGIGVCLVGNFDIERPTPQQMQSLARLTAYLMQTYKIPAGNILGHRDTKATECPGRNLNIAQVRRMASQVLADATLPDSPQNAQTASSVDHPPAETEP
jgi:hypothetical protein